MGRTRLLFLLLLLAAPAWAGPANAPGDEVLIAPRDKCLPGSFLSWKLKGETTIAGALTELSELTCERFFVPRELLETKVVLDVGDQPMSRYRLRVRVREALSQKGLDLGYVSASRVIRASEEPGFIAPAELDKGIHCAQQKCTVARALARRILTESGIVVTSARIIPAFRDGKPIGVRLYAIRPNSALDRLGFQNGDTLLAINGLELSTPEKVLGAVTKLRSASSLTVSLERRTKPMTMQYVVQ